MASERKVKCPGCEIYFYKSEEEYIQIKNRYWHKACYNSIKDDLKIENELIQYIYNLFNIKTLTPKLRAQLKDLIQIQGLSFEDILNSLKYWYEVKKNSTEKANEGIGIVPYVYKDAQKYYNSLINTKEANKNINSNSFKISKREITIKSPKILKQLKYIDLNFFEEEGGQNIIDK